MDKDKIIKEIKKKVKLDDKQVEKIGKLLSDNLLSGKGDKEKAIKGIMKELGISEKDANKIYSTIVDVIGKGLKDKLIGLLGKKK